MLVRGHTKQLTLYSTKLQVRIVLICLYILDQCIASVFVAKYLNLNIIKSFEKNYIATITRETPTNKERRPHATCQLVRI